MSDQVTPDQVIPEAVAPTGDDGPTPRPRTGNHRALPDDVVADELSSLPADQRRMLELAFYNDPAHIHIGAVTDVPLGPLASRLRRGLTRLKARWEVDDASRPRSASAAGAG